MKRETEKSERLNQIAQAAARWFCVSAPPRSSAGFLIMPHKGM